MINFFHRSRDDINSAVIHYWTTDPASWHTTQVELTAPATVPVDHTPSMYCRVMEEIEEVVGDKTTVEADDLDKLTYMHQVMDFNR